MLSAAAHPPQVVPERHFLGGRQFRAQASDDEPARRPRDGVVQHSLGLLLGNPVVSGRSTEPDGEVSPAVPASLEGWSVPGECQVFGSGLLPGSPPLVPFSLRLLLLFWPTRCIQPVCQIHVQPLHVEEAGKDGVDGGFRPTCHFLLAWRLLAYSSPLAVVFP